MAEVHFNRPDHADAETEITFIGLVNALLEMNVEYDIFGDSMAADMSAENGVAKFYGGDYDTVIIPSTKDTTSEVVEMVERLKAAGVKTEATFVPEGSHGGPAMYVEENLQKMVNFLKALL
jgi:hypothetical protein